jgi:L-fuculose-phosphate aldolase
MTYDQTRDDVARSARRLAEEGLLIGAAGNVSAVVPETGLVAVTATGVVLARCTPDEVTVVDRSGNVVAGDLAPTSEIDLHLSVYRAAEAGAVVHTHAPFATAVGCVIDELPVLHYQQMLLGGTVRVAPYATFGTSELALNVTRALDGRTAALMANHGAVSHADSLEKAVEGALLLEWCCRLFHLATSLAGSLPEATARVLDEQAQHDVVVAALERGYGTTKPADNEPDQETS